MTFDEVYPLVRRRTLLSEAKLRALWNALPGLPPGDLAELGVYRGGVARLLACWRRVHLFDTFTGIPAIGDPDLDWHKAGEYSADESEVREYLKGCPVVFHPGLFPDSAEGVDARFALVHLDADLYASTLAGLEWFWPRLNAGGLVVLDDYNWRFCRGVQRAVHKFFAGADVTFIGMAEYQVGVVKPEANPH